MEKELVMSEEVCPECDSPMAVRDGSNGKFLSCTKYPECKKTLPYIDEDTPTMQCDECGKPMTLRKGQYGHFYGCTGYPDCRQIVKANASGVVIDAPKPEKSDEKCPNCNKDMVLRSGKAGKFYGCTGYPECKTIVPHGEKKVCPDCGKYLSKRNGKKGEFWGCIGYPDCRHIENAS